MILVHKITVLFRTCYHLIYNPESSNYSSNKDFIKHNSFTYIGEWITDTPNMSEDLPMNSSCTKQEKAYHQCDNIYRTKPVSINTTLRHYNNVPRPSGLNMVRKGQQRILKGTERILKDKILRKIFGLVKG